RRRRVKRSSSSRHDSRNLEASRQIREASFVSCFHRHQIANMPLNEGAPAEMDVALSDLRCHPFPLVGVEFVHLERRLWNGSTSFSSVAMRFICRNGHSSRGYWVKAGHGSVTAASWSRFGCKPMKSISASQGSIRVSTGYVSFT